ncbi:GNAT family protein [Microbispora bryophytorum]|uniref:GNAT family N-acetyltransferase n=1 Tax=Microbispora bryophytorum TaxID=1460882 RepID=UPI0033EDA99C
MQGDLLADWKIASAYGSRTRFSSHDSHGLSGEGELSQSLRCGPAAEAEYRALFGRIFTKVYHQDLFAYGFDALELTEVYATVAAPNSASLAVLDRIGFEHVRDIAEDDGGITRVLRRRAA